MGCHSSKNAYDPQVNSAATPLPESAQKAPDSPKANDAASHSTATGGGSPGNSETSARSNSNNDIGQDRPQPIQLPRPASTGSNFAPTTQAVSPLNNTKKRQTQLVPAKKIISEADLAQKKFDNGQGRLHRRPLEEKLKKPNQLAASMAAKGVPFNASVVSDDYVTEGEEWQWAYKVLDGYNIRILADNTAEIIEVPTKQEAIDMVKGAPWKYFGCEFVSDGYIGEARVFTREVRLFENGYGPNEEQPDATGVLITSYRFLSELPEAKRPDVSDTEGCLQSLRGSKFTMKLPGRSEGVVDLPWMTIIPEYINPGGLECGEVDDGWFLAALSALAEFDGAVQRLFRKTPNLESMPGTAWNTYTVVLFDLPTWKATEVEVSEALWWHEDSKQLVGVRPSRTGELWPCYVEKACAIHCGGWEAIHAGTCTHAMSLLTGKKEVYTVKRGEDGNWNCFGHWDPNQKKWEDMQNQRSVLQLLWPSKWPEIGGGGEIQKALDDEAIFERLCAWDDADYMMCALSREADDDEDDEDTIDRNILGYGAEYTIVSCIDNAGGYDFDMLQLRDALGRGRHNTGPWADGGENWERYPAVKEACVQRAGRGEGLFWMERKDFADNFVKIYVCAYDMSKFMKEKDPTKKAKKSKVAEEEAVPAQDAGPPEEYQDAGDAFDLAELGIADEPGGELEKKETKKKKGGEKKKKKRGSKKDQPAEEEEEGGQG